MIPFLQSNPGNTSRLLSWRGGLVPHRLGCRASWALRTSALAGACNLARPVVGWMKAILVRRCAKRLARGRSPTLVSFHKTHEGAQMNRIRNFIKSEEAIAVTEYGLLVALVAVLLIGVVTIFGSSIKSWFSARTSTITTV